MANKKVKSVELLKHGSTIKENTFETYKGKYTIKLILYNENIYFHKMKNGVVVEIKNLSKETRKENKHG